LSVSILLSKKIALRHKRLRDLADECERVTFTHTSILSQLKNYVMLSFV